MSPLPGPRSYYFRFWRQATCNFFVWGKSQIVGALLVIAILALQIYYGVIPSPMTLAAVESIAWPYLALLLLLIAAAMAKAPVDLDRSRFIEIETEFKSKNEALQGLDSALRKLAMPTISEADIRKRNLVGSKLAIFSGEERGVLKSLLQHGKTSRRVMGGWASVDGVVDEALAKGEQSGLVAHWHPSLREIDQDQKFEIRPELRDALSFHLHGG